MTSRIGAMPIIETAYYWLAHNGIGRFTLRAIAEKTNCSLGTLTYHFPSKDDLLEAIIDCHITPRLRHWMTKPHTQAPLSELRALVKTLLPLTEEMDIWWRTRLHLYAFRAAHPKLRNQMKQVFLETEMFFEKKFTRHIHQASSPPHDDPSKLCRHFLLMLEGAGLIMLQLNMSERAQYGEPLLSWLGSLGDDGRDIKEK